jgi:hypothetical protein
MCFSRFTYCISQYCDREFTPDQLATLIRLQNDALLKVAAQVAVVHEMVERLRSEWNSRTGQDPFQVKKKKRMDGSQFLSLSVLGVARSRTSVGLVSNIRHFDLA